MRSQPMSQEAGAQGTDDRLAVTRFEISIFRLITIRQELEIPVEITVHYEPPKPRRQSRLRRLLRLADHIALHLLAVAGAWPVLEQVLPLVPLLLCLIK